jgi:hypothetical protein
VATPRGPSSRTTLEIDWQSATVPSASVVETEGTVAAPRRRALPAADAMAVLAGGDRRPLLVLRECLKCSGTEDALMTSKQDNERTYLLARWFHCVRLSPDVLEDDHPFRALFPGEKPAHVFIANYDGTARHDLQGTHSRSELWAAMEGAIEANYQGGFASALQRLARLLNDLDEVDRAISDLDTRFELAVSKGADASKTKKMQAELAERRGQRDELLATAAKIAVLEPKPVVPAQAR